MSDNEKGNPIIEMIKKLFKKLFSFSSGGDYEHVDPKKCDDFFDSAEKLKSAIQEKMKENEDNKVLSSVFLSNNASAVNLIINGFYAAIQNGDVDQDKIAKSVYKSIEEVTEKKFSAMEGDEFISDYLNRTPESLKENQDSCEKIMRDLMNESGFSNEQIKFMNSIFRRVGEISSEVMERQPRSPSEINGLEDDRAKAMAAEIANEHARTNIVDNDNSMSMNR